MSNISSANGKSFEFICLTSIAKNNLFISVIKDKAYTTAEEAFNSLSPQEQNNRIAAAKVAIDYIFKLEPILLINSNLSIQIQPDSNGCYGDSRDLVIRDNNSNLEVGFSIKWNHEAVKHSRLSPTIDFAERWFNLKCSSQYFDTITPIFNSLDLSLNWSGIPNKEIVVYRPILTAFMQEMKDLYINNPDLPAKLVDYLIGSYDHYKVIGYPKQKLTEIQAFNFKGTLAKDSIYKISRNTLPTELISVNFKPGKNNELILNCDNNWAFSFRIHNASTKVEKSLKFDIKFNESLNHIDKRTIPW